MSKIQLLCLGMLCAVCGCGGTPDGQRPTAPVEVTVTHLGKPVEGATVTFITAEQPMASNGITDSKGVTNLSTYGPKDGAIIGSNLVTISKTEIDKSVKTKTVDPDQADTVGYTPLSPLKSLIPSKYAMPGTSGLKAEVKSGGNKFTFELTN
jgi:hypothetical protein